MGDESPEWHPDDDPLDLKFTYRNMKVLPPLPSTPPKPEDQMLAWQQFQRLKFEFKERGLPTDGSYQPTPPAGGWPPRSASAAKNGGDGLHRSTSTPVLQNDPRLPTNRLTAHKGLQRGMSGVLGNKRVSTAQAWNRSTSPSVDLGQSPASAVRPKSGTFSSRRNSVSLGQGEMVKLKSLGDTFEKAKQHLNDGHFDKALTCYSMVVTETLTQRALCLIQKEDYAEAVVNCDFALHFEPSNGKALVRKAKALAKLKRDTEAKACRSVAMPHLKANDPELWEVGQLLGIAQGPAPSVAIEDRPVVKVEEDEDGEVKVTPHVDAEVQKTEALPPPPAADQLPPPPVAKSSSPNSTLSSSGNVPARVPAPVPRTSSGGRGRGTPISQRKNLPRVPSQSGSPRDTPLSPTASNKKLPQLPPGARTSASLKKPSSAAPLPPSKKKTPLSSPRDPLDPSYKYADMEDADLPPLPADAPSIDEDMLRWQQYQRLKSEYKDRNLELRFQGE